MKLETLIVEKFVVATGNLLTFRAPDPSDDRRNTVMLTYAPSNWVDEGDLASTTAEHDVDVIHLEFQPEREFEGPVNIKLCEDRNGTILTWPRCQLWVDQNDRLVLVVPEGQDFGFAFDGAALIRVTDLDTGVDRERGVERAKALLMSAALRVPSDLPSERHEFKRRPRGDLASCAHARNGISA